jgi:hypothetical protein
MREIEGPVIPPRGEKEILIASIAHQQLFQQPADVKLMPAHLARSKWNEVDADAHALTTL